MVARTPKTGVAKSCREEVIVIPPRKEEVARKLLDTEIDLFVGRKLIKARTVAAMADVSVRTVWRWREAGSLPKPIKISGTCRWNRLVIEKWIEAGCPGE